MGLQRDMMLPIVKPNLVQRSLQRMGATSVGNAIFSAILGPLDRLSHRLTGGRTTVGRAVGGLPVVMLTTTGAKSGKQRTNPVNVIPFGDDLALVASNYGRGTVPGWAHNLIANPNATLTYRDQDHTIVAGAAEGDDYEEAFAAALVVYPGYARYRRNVTHTIPIFTLKSLE